MRTDLKLVTMFVVALLCLSGCNFSETTRVASVVEETDILSGETDNNVVTLPFHTIVERDGNKVIVLHFSTDRFPDVEHPSLLISRAGSNVQVYLDDEWVYGQSFSQRPMAHTWNTPQLVNFSREQLDSATHIRIKLFAFSGDHTLLEPMYLGEHDRLKTLYERFRFFQNHLTLAITVATLVLLVVSLLLWIASGRERNYLMAMATSISLIAACHHYFVVNSFLSHAMLQAVTHISLDWMGVFVALWIVNIKGLRTTYNRAFIFWGWCCTLVNLALPWNWTAPFVEWLHFVTIGIVVLVLLLPATQSQASRREVYITRITGTLGCALCLVDMMVQMRFIQVPGLPRFLPITFFLVFLTNNAILLQRFSRTYRIARRSQKELQTIVAQRESELDHYYAENTRLKSQQARTEERERIMRDLHDGMGGHLASALAVAKVDEHQDDQAQKRLTETLQTALVEMRMLINNSADEFDELGQALGSLRSTIEPLLNDAGLELHWKLDPFGKMPILTISERMHVVRVVQECITNVLKHTDATIVTVSSEQVGKNYRVQIANNGSTPVTNSASLTGSAIQDRAQGANAQQGNGQRNMKYRAAQLHGSFNLTPTADGGALATLEFPFDQSMAEASA